MNPLLIQRKESIILDTVDAIDKYGVQAISTREIAKSQGITERVIFNHFPKKSDLILSVLDYYSKYDASIIETAYSKKMAPREAITYFIDCYSIYYENYPALTAITQSYDVLQNNPEFNDKVKSIFNNRAVFIQNQIEGAKRTGQIPSDTDIENLADIILGTFHRICLKWRMSNYNFSLRERSLASLEMILDSFWI